MLSSPFRRWGKGNTEKFGERPELIQLVVRAIGTGALA